MKKIIISPLLFAASANVLATEVAQTETPEAVNSQKVSGFYIGAGYGSFSYDTEQDLDNDDRYENLTAKTDGNSVKIYAGVSYKF
jgi:hypothetical protein